MHSKMIIVMSLVAVALAAPTGDNNQMPTPIKNAISQGFEMLDSMIDETIAEGFKLDEDFIAYTIFDRSMTGILGISSEFCYDDRPVDKVQAFADNLRQKVDELVASEYDNLRAQPDNFEESIEMCEHIEFDRTDDNSWELVNAMDSLMYEFDQIISEVHTTASMFECPPEHQPSEAQAKRMFEWAQKYADLVNNFASGVDSEGMSMPMASETVEKLSELRRKVGKAEGYLKENNMSSLASQASELRDTLRETRNHVEKIADREAY